MTSDFFLWNIILKRTSPKYFIYFCIIWTWPSWPERDVTCNQHWVKFRCELTIVLNLAKLIARHSNGSHLNSYLLEWLVHIGLEWKHWQWHTSEIFHAPGHTETLNSTGHGLTQTWCIRSVHRMTVFLIYKVVQIWPGLICV